jgi:hypothetical protein
MATRRLLCNGSAVMRRISARSVQRRIVPACLQHSQLWARRLIQCSRTGYRLASLGGSLVSGDLAEWGLEFADNMPEEIREAIRKARGEGPSSLEDEEYRRRLQDKFGNRWRTKMVVQAKPDEDGSKPATPVNDEKDTDDRAAPVRPHRPKRRRPKRVQVIRFKAIDGGTGEGVEREVAVDVPKFRFAGKDDFEHPWHLATWLPSDPVGPTVLINEDSPILLEAIKHHQEQYPDVYAQDVAKIVRDT